MHIKQTQIPNAQPILFKKHVSTIHVLTVRKNNETLAKCMNHWVDGANLKGVTFNKNCSSLTGHRFEMPSGLYIKRLI